jgi:hypothetical protein
VNCKEFQESISPAVDQCLSNSAAEQFHAHARRCSPCRCEYELDLTTKLVVRAHVCPVRTPSVVAVAVMRSLDREGARSRFVSRYWWRRQWERPVTRPLLALAASSALVFSLVDPFRPSAPASGRDLIEQSVMSHRAVLGGTGAARFAADRPPALRAYFASRIGFPVHIPVLAHSALIGGAVDEVAGVPYAQVVYQAGGGMITMFQVSWDAVREGKRLCLPVRAAAPLRETGWFCESLPGGGSVVVRAWGGTLCAIVSPFSPDTMRLALAAEEEEAAW